MASVQKKVTRFCFKHGHFHIHTAPPLKIKKIYDPLSEKTE